MKGAEKYNIKVGLGTGKNEPTKRQPSTVEKRVMTRDQAYSRIDKMTYTPEVKAAIKKVIGAYPANSMEKALKNIDQIAAKIFQSSTGDLGREQPQFEAPSVPVIDPRDFANRENQPLPGDGGARFFPGGRLPVPPPEPPPVPRTVRSNENRAQGGEVPPGIQDCGGCECGSDQQSCGG